MGAHNKFNLLSALIPDDFNNSVKGTRQAATKRTKPPKLAKSKLFYIAARFPLSTFNVPYDGSTGTGLSALFRKNPANIWGKRRAKRDKYGGRTACPNICLSFCRFWVPGTFVEQ
ncbi:hypothetical protein TcasGA2_TC007835 [Tribolium castaneum]|uniref:Uncharacterized protein n=1 Tax=Tribolium castaneum TaxID=7070 RepID=D2A2D8_TRICA|nr:hypothetical protein TcasGA2_TC007835 [Tribolium castaneum]